jgi:hypothetical protein
MSRIGENVMLVPPSGQTECLWRSRTLRLELGGETHVLRLVRFARGWLASTDSIRGPTLGHDASPYLAARRALEPLGIGLVEAMTAVGRLDLGQVGAETPRSRKSRTASEAAATSSPATAASRLRRIVV